MDKQSLKMIVSGSTGLVGRAVVKYFRNAGAQVQGLVRPDSQPSNDSNIICWDVKEKQMDFKALECMDAIIHLAGANIADKRWTEESKKEILASRVEGTKFLCESLLTVKNKPKVLFCASAVGFYGYNAPQSDINEASAVGNDFLANVCDEWEKATLPLQLAGVRVVNMRFGMVLSSNGGALAKMLPIFQLGLGGKLGSGKQHMSWIDVNEIPRIIAYLIDKPEIVGPVNFVSPGAVTNAEFTKALGKVIHRPTIFPVPAAGIKLLFGEMGESLLLNGVKVVPQKLLDSGYKFQYPEIEPALRACFV